MPITGLRTTTNFATDERPQNYRDGILMLYPNGKAPLTAMRAVMKTKTTDDPEFHWWEKSLPTQRMVLSANVTTAATTLTVTSGAKGAKAGSVLRIEHSGEIVRVVSDPASDTSLTVQRAFGETAAATVTVASQNPNIHIIGTAFEEGSNAPTGINYDPVKQTNYTQIFRDTLEMTRTASKTRLRTKEAIAEAKRECLETHTIQIEKASWWGERLETTINGKPARTSRGILNWIPSANKVTADSSGYTMEWFEEQMYNAFLFGSSEKVGMLGNRALLSIQQVIRKNSTFNIQTGLKEYGMNVARLITPFGELVLKTHPLFNQLRDDLTATTASDTAWYGAESQLAILDMANICWRAFSGDDTRYEKDLQQNGMDGMKSGYLTEGGYEVDHATTHYLIQNLHKAIADA